MLNKIKVMKGLVNIRLSQNKYLASNILRKIHLGVPKINIGGTIKVLDGNDRARPSITMKIFSQLNLLSHKEEKSLKHWSIEKLYNHEKKNIGKIIAEIQ